MIEYSVIIPAYNEQGSLEELHRSVHTTMKSLGRPFEIIFVNDGSNDDSLHIVEELRRLDDTLVLVDLGARFGKSKAMQTGFERSRGRTIITIDADLQYDVEDVSTLLSMKDEGFDVVCGWRHERHDPPLKIIASWMANILRRWTLGEKIHDVGCSFRVYTREAFASLRLDRERHRFITAILAKKGFRLGEIKINHHPRKFGRSKYGIANRFFGSIPDYFHILFNRDPAFS